MIAGNKDTTVTHYYLMVVKNYYHIAIERIIVATFSESSFFLCCQNKEKTLRFIVSIPFTPYLELQKQPDKN